MPDRRRPLRRENSTFNGGSLTASIKSMTGPSATRLIIQNREWQREGWDFYHAMGEFWFGITWKSNAISRVRLKAAIMRPGVDEPEIIEPDAKGDDRKVLDLTSRFAGGTTGQSAILKSLTVKMSVPGEGYIVAEDINRDRVWSTKSSDEVRRRAERRPNESEYEVQVEENAWRPLVGDSLIFRIWNPDEQYSWRASSETLPALPILRELDLINRRIITDLVSRLASNGILAIPEEITFPVRAEFKDAADPFIAEFIDLASKSIANPGTASAAIPVPLRMPGEFIDKIKHIPFTTLFDPKLLDTRDKTLRRLATTLNMPQEVLTGVENVNHWTAWQIDESGVKLYIAPMCEILCHGLTVGYLHPAMETVGMLPLKEDGSRYVMWYDATELTSKPDLAENANAAYDRLEISGTAYRREMGFSEEDAPKDDELKDVVLKTLVRMQGSPEAVKELTGIDVAPPQPEPMPGQPGVLGEDPDQQNGRKGPPPAERPEANTTFELSALPDVLARSM
jgi:hypothetical protein